jgi:hypothetical protein
MLLHGLAARHRTTASPDAVWDVLVDTEAWPRWGPTVSAVDLEEGDGAGPAGTRVRLGTRGRVRTPVGLWLPFEVTEWVEGERWAWRVAGVPATSHAVRPTATGAEVVMAVPWWAPAYLAVCEVGVRRVARLAEAR